MTPYLGYIAAVLSTFSFLPQAIKTIYTRDTSGLSVIMYACLTVGIVLWFIYGYLIGDGAVMWANGVTFFFALPVLIITVMNKIRGVDGDE